MKVEKFSKPEATALIVCGFTIGGDNDEASVTGEMTVTLIKPAPSDASAPMLIEITLPNGQQLRARMTRAGLIAAAE